MSESAIQLAGAAVALGGRTIWSGVDVRVDAGEFVAVLGPNGVGKSTMVKVLLGLVPLSEGSVRVLGATPEEARPHVGYLPQRRTFDPAARVRGIDIVRLGEDGARWGVPLPFSARWSARGRERDRRVRDTIEMVGATAYAERPIGELSGGEQQRLLIAQALVRRPRMLLLDEPLDSLDLPNQSAIAALISTVARKENVAVVMVAHDVNPILGYLDGVVYLAGGGAACGSVEDVITGPTLSRLYQTPIEVLRTSDGRLVVVGHPDAPAVHGGHHSAHA